ncbi:MAG: hypothetical protein EOM05_12440, partial [Clostridia bacterium]|nr:hypothetical protein [Clostridia bacterium]
MFCNFIANFSKIFSVNVANSYAHVNETFTQIVVDNDFLVDSGIDISLLYANNEKINIKTPTNTYVQSYTQMVGGAFEISVTTNFSAPSEVSFCTITYKKDSTNAISANMVEASISKISSANGGNDIANATFSISGRTLSIKTMTGTLSTKLRLNLRIIGTDLQTYKDYTINITSIYNATNLTVGTLDSTSGDYFVTAGFENKVTINSGGIVLSGDLLVNKGNINGINLSFANVSADEFEASEHMKTEPYQSGPNVGLYS